MTTDARGGFTIIEVMLFLAITGGLFAALMIGVNAGITQQRYLDSVRSYKALLQNEYSEAITTRNDVTDEGKCNDSDGSVDTVTSRSPSRGTSKCVILGRAIRIDGAEITTSSVTGLDQTGNSAAIDETSDTNAFTTYYKAKLADFDKQTTSLDWETNLTSVSGDKSTAMILILRSPISGAVKVYVSETAATDLSGIITDTNTSSILKNCVKGESGSLPKQMITIDPSIAGPDAVHADGGENEVCQ